MNGVAGKGSLRDGSRPDIWRYTAEVREGGKAADLSDYR